MKSINQTIFSKSKFRFYMRYLKHELRNKQIPT